jgi:proteasome lid subunit RPN8/RPN11
MSSLIPRERHPSGTRLSLPEAELSRLHDHAVAGFPYEGVGILAGRRGEDPAEAKVTRVVPLTNERAADAARRYQVSGLTVMRAEEALQAEGLDLLGYYHSHPDHPAAWSDSDRDQALPNLSYVIAAVEGSPAGPRVVDTLAWRLREDRSVMDHEALQIAPAPPVAEPAAPPHPPALEP